ncbi:hypothetical protein HN954_02260 [bacterium]|jgi:hypothetical protein|nr:hypothetical protein [bacterium]MBT6832224.1 hypothetical protein [bacterium]MBT6996230.1 hypothetical protein [bacterium]
MKEFFLGVATFISALFGAAGDNHGGIGINPNVIPPSPIPIETSAPVPTKTTGGSLNISTKVAQTMAAEALKNTTEFQMNGSHLEIIDYKVLECVGCWNFSFEFRVQDENANVIDVANATVSIRNGTVAGIEFSPEAQKSSMSAEECEAQNGRVVNTIDGDTCKEDEILAGEIDEFMSLNFCCIKKNITAEVEKAITNFEECVTAGFSVQESFPRQCTAPDGEFFVEILEENPEKSVTPEETKPLESGSLMIDFENEPEITKTTSEELDEKSAETDPESEIIEEPEIPIFSSANLRSVKNAFLAELGETAEFKIEITLFDPEFCRGKITVKSEEPKIFLAAKKSHETWIIPFYGNEEFPCELLDALHFPMEMISECTE